MSNTEEEFIKLKGWLEAELQDLDDQINPLLDRREYLAGLLYGRSGSPRGYQGPYSGYRRFRVPSYTKYGETVHEGDTDEE